MLWRSTRYKEIFGEGSGMVKEVKVAFLKKECVSWDLRHECVRARSLQSCPTPCDPLDCSPPGSSVHGIFQARILEWVVVPSSRRTSRSRIKHVSAMSAALTGGFFTTRGTWETHLYVHLYVYTLFILTCTFILPHGLGFYYPGSECLGEGNGNPLQYSCLENSVDRGAWWAAVYGVAQSRTRLKWLSSSSSSRMSSNFRSSTIFY